VLGASALSTTAVFAGLRLAGIGLNTAAIMIIGIGAEMAIFLVSEHMDLAHGMPPRQALLEAARSRDRHDHAYCGPHAHAACGCHHLRAAGTVPAGAAGHAGADPAALGPVA
jgi:hypothetical protein